MQRRTLLVALAVAAGGLAGAAPASAHQDPRAARTAAFDLDLGQDRRPGRAIGDTINYTVDVRQRRPGRLRCARASTSNLQFPGSTAHPAQRCGRKLAGPDLHRADGRSRRSGRMPTPSAVNPGVTFVSRASLDRGRACSRTPTRARVNINKVISARIFTPSITIDKVGSIDRPVPAPQDVTYTFYVRNDSDRPPGGDRAANVKVTDDLCGIPTYVERRHRRQPELQTNETWTFTCTLTHPGARHLHTTSRWPTATTSSTAAPSRSSARLTTGPSSLPSPPAPAGRGQAGLGQQAPCTLSRANSTTVRASQLNTIRVRVAQRRRRHDA